MNSVLILLIGKVMMIIALKYNYLLNCNDVPLCNLLELGINKGMHLKEAEDIKKRWQEYTEELYKNDLHDPDNHDGVTTHLEQISWNVK